MLVQGKNPAGWKMVHDGCYVIAERECGELTEYFSSLTGETGNRKRKNTLKLCCVFYKVIKIIWKDN